MARPAARRTTIPTTGMVGLALLVLLTGPTSVAQLRVDAGYSEGADLSVWWPPLDRTAADISGRAFFIRSHPERHHNESGWSEIVMHEVTHYVSAHQAPEQKQALTKQFLDRCPADSRTGFYDLLEEPIAVAWGNAAFAKYVRKQPLRYEDNWYWRPLAEVMGKLLWSYVDAVYDSDQTINDGLVPFAGEQCAVLLRVSDMIFRREASDDSGQ